MTNTPSINTGESDKWFYKAQPKKRRQLKIPRLEMAPGRTHDASRRNAGAGFAGPKARQSGVVPGWISVDVTARRSTPFRDFTGCGWSAVEACTASPQPWSWPAVRPALAGTTQDGSHDRPGSPSAPCSDRESACG